MSPRRGGAREGRPELVLRHRGRLRGRLVGHVAGALPPNQLPAATGDSHTTNHETTLTVGAPGVLANDGDPDADVLTAVRGSDPEHGSLVLGSNGSFRYTPAIGYSGPDSFTYTASDGESPSAPAMVLITAGPAPATDTVTVARKEQLSVTATSSAQPNARSTVVDYGTMTYKSRTKTYSLTAPAPTKPQTVTVT